MTKRETYIAKQAKRLSKGQIDRRRFVMSALATGVTMPTAMSLASRAEGAVPKSGGHLRYGAALPLRSDMAWSEGALMQALGDTLIDLDADGTPIGGLAEQFHTNDAGTVWVFDLRPDVVFQSGNPLTPGDVLASFSAATKISHVARGITKLIRDARQDGQNRVILSLHRPHHNFAALLANPNLIIRRVTGDAFDSTGAYRLQHVEQGVSAHLVRNLKDWRRDRGHFESIDIYAMPDATLRQSAIMNGEVDVIDDVDPRALAMLSNSPNIAIHEAPNAQHIHFKMRLDRGPFSDPHLRAALKTAVDRRALCNEALLGHGDIGDDAPWMFDRSVALFDQDKARWLVGTAGGRGPIKLALPDQTFPSAEIAAHLVARAAGDIGLDIEVLGHDHGTEWHLKMARSALCGDASFAAEHPSGFPACKTGWATPDLGLEFARKVQTARSIQDLETQGIRLAGAAGIFAREGGMFLPLWANDIYAHSTSLAHPNKNQTDQINPAAILKSWWFS